jgi:ABC-type branched-subunit amino acid transport system ATPase component/ABC-type branched-subunit amino acid transport system permease subunit
MIWFRFALLGLGTGALYALCAQGLVLIYRSSGVVNFAQSGFVLLGGYSYYELREIRGQSAGVSVTGALIIGAIAGLLVHLLIMRPMRRSSPIARVVATLGVLVVIQSAAILRYEHDLKRVTSILPTRTVDIFGAHLGIDRVYIFVICLALTVVLWACYRYTSFGRVTSAVAEGELAAASMGHSPDMTAGINWMIGAVLGAFAGVLIGPITFLEPNQLVQLIVPALAAALLGGFNSFPLAFAAAGAIGVIESEMTLLVTNHGWYAGWSQSVSFIAVIAVLVVRGKGIQLRSHILDRLPAVGSGRIRPVRVSIAFAASCTAMAVLANQWAVALTVTIAFAMVCLSVVVVTGYAGQLSLAQFMIGTAGAFAGARLMAVNGVSFLPACLAAVAAAVLLGLIVGAPALRTRGINLAIATLGLGVVVYALILNNFEITGGVSGLKVGPVSLFGWDIDPAKHPQRYGIVALCLLLAMCLGVANLRRGAAGRRLLAVRSGERPASALGVNVYAAKLFSFMLAAGIAGVGGCTLAFLNSNVIFSRFDIFTSISVVTATVVGGVGFIPGALLGSTLMTGGIVSRYLDKISDLGLWLGLIGGVFVIITLRSDPDGMFEMNRKLVAATVRRVKRSRVDHTRSVVRDGGTDPGSMTALRTERHRVVPTTLSVEGLSVRFGGVAAVDNMSLVIRPGRVHGLIGPNGAGKTTLIDAVTGFIKPAQGRICLGEVEIDSWSACRRAGAGVARSFQSGDLFGDLTVLENIAVACDSRAWTRYVTDLVVPRRIELSAAANVAVEEFQLRPYFDMKPHLLSFGRRRTVAIARAIAAQPSVLLLDEPASGLDEQESAELAELIRSLADDWGIAVLLVEHNLDLVLSVCDEVTVMESGVELLAAATPSEVRRHPAVLAAYIGVRPEAECAMPREEVPTSC